MTVLPLTVTVELPVRLRPFRSRITFESVIEIEHDVEVEVCSTDTKPARSTSFSQRLFDETF
jgi:hypothetical protein